jgi:hypothetical protein
MYAGVFFCAVFYLMKWCIRAYDEQQKAAASRKPAVRCVNNSRRRTGTAGVWSSSSESDELTTEDYIILDDIDDMFGR